jgi:hypothetical protein
MLLFDPVAARDYIETNISSDIRGMYFFYWMTTYIHLASIVLMFAQFENWSIIVAIVCGFLTLLWHIINIILFFTAPSESQPGAPIWKAVLYWLEIVFSFIILNATIALKFKIKTLIKKGLLPEDGILDSQRTDDDLPKDIPLDIIDQMNLKTLPPKRRAQPKKDIQYPYFLSFFILNRHTNPDDDRSALGSRVSKRSKRSDDDARSQISETPSQALNRLYLENQRKLDRKDSKEIDDGSFVGGYRSAKDKKNFEEMYSDLGVMRRPVKQDSRISPDGSRVGRK